MRVSSPPADPFRLSVVTTVSIAVFLLFAFAPLSAQLPDYTWHQIGNGLFGTTATSFGFAQNGNVVVGTPSGIFILPKDEERWQKTNVDVNVLEIAVSPTGALLAGTEVGTYRSTDDGRSWTVVFTVSGQYHFFFNGSSGIVYAGQRGYLGPTGYYFRSTDDGVNWETVWWAGDIYGGDNWIVVNRKGETLLTSDSGLLVSRNNGQSWGPTGMTHRIARLLFLADGRLLGTTPNGIWRSTDDGAGWERFDTLAADDIQVGPNGHYYYRYSNPHGFRGHTLSGLYRSTDEGASRTRILPGIDVAAFGLAPDGTLWAGADGTVLRSTDNGSSWERYDRGIDNVDATRIVQAPSGDLYALLRTGTHALSEGEPLRFYSLYRSSDAGENWTFLRDSLSIDLLESDAHGNIFTSRTKIDWYRSGDSMMSGTTTEVHQSNDRGSSWRSIAAGEMLMDYSSNGNGTIAIAFKDDANDGAAGGELVFSSDSGKTWARLTDAGKAWENIPDGKGIDAVEVLPNGQMVFSISVDTVAWEADLYRIDRSGSVATGLSDSLTFSRLSTSTSGVMLGSGWIVSADTSEDRRNGIYRSVDNGTAWSLVYESPTIDSAYFSFGPDDLVFASSEIWPPISQPISQTFRSTDGGLTWNGPFTYYLYDIQYHPSGPLYGLIGRTAYYSADRGRNWVDLRRGLPVAAANDLVVTPAGALLCATDFRGVHVLQRTNSAHDPRMESEHRLEIRETGPETRTIHFTLSHPGDVSLSLHDLLGRRIATILNESMESGEHRIVLDPPSLPGGTYLLTMKTVDGIFSEKIQLH